MAEQLPETMKIYQPTTNPKHGSGGVENLPVTINSADLYRVILGAETGATMGMPAWGADPKTLATKVLVEGRGDAGSNRWDTNNKKDQALYQSVSNALGLNPSWQYELSAVYPAAVAGADRRAQQQGIPTEKAWNGTGKSLAGKTGAQHAAKFETAMQLDAANHPKNAQLMDTIKRGLAGQFTSQDHLVGRIADLEAEGITIGNRSVPTLQTLQTTVARDKNLAADVQVKAVLDAIAGANKLDQYQIIGDAARNSYRNDAGIPEKQLTKDNSTLSADSKTLVNILASNPAFKRLFQADTQRVRDDLSWRGK